MLCMCVFVDALLFAKITGLSLKAEALLRGTDSFPMIINYTDSIKLHVLVVSSIDTCWHVRKKARGVIIPDEGCPMT